MAEFYKETAHDKIEKHVWTYKSHSSIEDEGDGEYWDEHHQNAEEGENESDDDGKTVSTVSSTYSDNNESTVHTVTPRENGSGKPLPATAQWYGISVAC